LLWHTNTHTDEENPKKTQERACYKGNKINDNMDARRSNWLVSTLLLHSTPTGRGNDLMKWYI
jgi:hypothetical protein